VAKISHVAHRADIMRLDVLLEYGGIYLDSDVIVLQPFPKDWFSKSVVLGQEGASASHGLCNAVILSEIGAKFLKYWRANYKGFTNSASWNLYSVRLPKLLWMRYPEQIFVVGHKALFWPLHYDNHVEMVFGANSSWGGWGPESFAYHTWGSKTYDLYLRGLSVEVVRKGVRAFDRVAAELLDVI